MIRSELAKLRRGLIAMREAFGWQFTAVILVVAGLLLASLAARAGFPALVLGTLLLLLAIRAHDIGDVDEAEPTELDSDHSPLARAREEEAARIAAATFLRDRHATALGRPHDGQEL